jgi:hypothetical protein
MLGGEGSKIERTKTKRPGAFTPGLFFTLVSNIQISRLPSVFCTDGETLQNNVRIAVDGRSSS